MSQEMRDMNGVKQPPSAEANSASRLAFISLAVLVIGIVMPLAALPLSIVALVLSKKAKALPEIDSTALSVAKVTYVLSIVVLVLAVLMAFFVLGFMTMNIGASTLTEHTVGSGGVVGVK